MVPLYLTLTNFLSYSHGQLDFTGIHTACICGANGAGKSALLESMGWALWGKCRATNEEDLIRSGTTEAMVDFIFRCEGTSYRVLRVRPRGKSGTLEFQIQQGDGQFRVLTSRTNRQTQEAINQVLRMDYETFINSAYLRQGRADEFTVKKPVERKEVLTEILGLNRYDDLAEKAKEKARDYKTQADLLKEQLQKILEHLGTRLRILEQQTDLEAQQRRLSEEQRLLDAQLLGLQQQVQYRQTLEEQRHLLLQQQEGQGRTLKRTTEEHQRQRQTVNQLEAILTNRTTIEAGYHTYQTLMAQEVSLDQDFVRHQELVEARQRLERELDSQRNQIQLQLQTLVTLLETKQEQRREALDQLKDSDTIEKNLELLRQARERLRDYEERQARAQPQMQERQRLHQQLQSERLELEAQYKEVRYQTQKVAGELARRGLLEKQLEQVSQQTQRLQRQKVYLERVIEKGHESRALKQRYESQLTEYQKQLAELEDKDRFMQQSLTHCPLCHQDLDEEHREQIHVQHEATYRQLQEEELLLQHQISYLDQEIKVLRTAYTEIKPEVDSLDGQLQKQGSLQQQLEAFREKEELLQELKLQERTLKHQLEEETYGLPVRQQIQLVELELKRLDFNENDFALLRAEVDRFRWAELRSQSHQEARRRLEPLDRDIPALEQRCANGRQILAEGKFATQAQEALRHVQTQIQQLHYDPAQHQALKAQLQSERAILRQYEALQQATEEIEVAREWLTRLMEEQTQLTQQLHQLQEHLTRLEGDLGTTTDPQPEMLRVQAQAQHNRTEQDQHYSALGACRQQLEFLDQLEAQQEADRAQMEHCRHQHSLYKELATAFGKNGIQALIIESVLPELEQEANQLLARLSENQLHVRFITQKATKTTAKLIETLDILIADSRGTRPYETYSGGEAFRVNFAIRLALSRLLARRSGAALQTLIVDEGFGSQDRDGRERLVEAINLIAHEFERILVITHINDLKEVFPARVEVEKGERGSQLSVVL
ncbi:AAA family ATPase [Anthocerotibacter panamensis]|uniref:AAA family ATPase n=1 Tax=Anthocerotibacter panamensis TaxID=2857077 RepID=UPI001C40877C|nr:SMC family ATPase [Anthocerotibacter panamensis]